MRYLRPFLAPLLAGVLIAGAIGWLQQPNTPEEAARRSLRRLLERMQSTPLVAADPEAMLLTDFDLFVAMEEGSRPVDPALFAKYRLEEMADRLAQTVASHPSGLAQDLDPLQGMYIVRVYLARGNQLCQAGKTSEGSAWFLRALAFNRKSATKDVFSCLVESHILQVTARYAAVWPEADRRSFLQGLHELPSPPDVRALTTQDWSYPVLRVALQELAGTPPADRTTQVFDIYRRLGRELSCGAPAVVIASHLMSAAELDAEANALIKELEPLTPAAIQAATRSAQAALERLSAEEARLDQFLAQAGPRSPSELRRLLAGKADTLILSPWLLGATDDEIAERMAKASSGLDQRKLALLARYPAPLEATQRAAVVFRGLIHLGNGDYEQLLSSRIRLRCLELALETGGRPTAAQVAALEGPRGGALRLEQDPSGRAMILYQHKAGQYDKGSPFMVLAPIR